MDKAERYAIVQVCIGYRKEIRELEAECDELKRKLQLVESQLEEARKVAI